MPLTHTPPSSIIFAAAEREKCSHSSLINLSIRNYEGTLVNALLYHCGDSLSGINGVIRPGIVHRIDKDTSHALPFSFFSISATRYETKDTAPSETAQSAMLNIAKFIKTGSIKSTITKFFAQRYLSDGSTVVFIRGIVQFNYAENGVRDTLDIQEKYKKGILGAIPEPDLIATLLDFDNE